MISGSAQAAPGGANAFVTSPVGVEAADITELAGLSPEGMLAYVGNASAIIDGQITASMDSMYADLAAAGTISKDLESLSALSAHLLGLSSDANHKSEVTREQLEAMGVLDFAEAFGADPDAESWNVSPAMVDKVSAQLEQRQSRINSQQERKMLLLQESMRQRSQITQLVSNILRERGETMSQLVRNVG